MDELLAELFRRIDKYEERVKPLKETRELTLPAMVMTAADEQTRLHFRKEGVTASLEGMKREVEVLCNVKKTR